MGGLSTGLAPKVRGRERVVVHVDSPAARWIGALALLSAVFWLVTQLSCALTPFFEKKP